TLRQPAGEWLPVVPAGAAAVHPQSALWRVMLRIAGDGNDVNGVRLVGVHIDDEAEVGRQIAADLLPRLASVIGAHDIPVFLHEQRVRPRRMHRQPVDAVADFGGRVGYLFRTKATVNRAPRLGRVVGAENTGGRDRDEDPSRVGRVLHDRVQAHPSGTWLPGRPRIVVAQPAQLLPGD